MPRRRLRLRRPPRATRPAVGGGGSHIHDRATAATDHRRRRRPDPQHDRSGVDLLDQVPVSHAQVAQGRDPDDARVVHQDVEPTLVSFDVRDRLGPRALVGDIEMGVTHIEPPATECRSHLLALCVADIGDHDADARRGERFGVGRALAPGAAGDECDMLWHLVQQHMGMSHREEQPPDQPNVKHRAWAPASRNSTSKSRSAIGSG